MITVTKKFRDNFEAFADDRVKSGEFSVSEMAELKGMVRKDLMPGPDQLRSAVDCLMIAGVTIPATIDDEGERYKLWDEYFEWAVEDIAYRRRVAA